jgi:multicomponent Na+:H+ antiporter subunit D
MVNTLLVLPLLIPLLAAIAAFLLRRRHLLQRIFGGAGAIGLLAAGLGLLASVWRDGIQVVHVGGWPAPIGITLVADLFSAVMVVVAGFVGLVVVVYSLVTIDRDREEQGYYAHVQILLMGVCGAFLTGDLFNLYVWFEVMLIASFVLLSLGGERAQTEGAIKYVTLNLMSSAFFLAAVGILYGITGTLNMADLAITLRASSSPGLVTTAAILFFAAFGIKAAVFPAYFWLPASYHTPPAAIGAIFAGLLTKVGVYALIRVFTLLFVHDIAYTHTLILIIAGLTMLSGVLGAIAQLELRRVLSFQVIVTIGYMLMGLGLFTPLALAGAVYYIVQDAVAKTNLFLIGGVVHRFGGTDRLHELGGIYRVAPLFAMLFFVPAMSLAGIPPFSGFFAKLPLVQEGLRTEQYGIVAVALIVSPLTLLSMTRIWDEAFWKSRPRRDGSEADVDREVDPSLPSLRRARWGAIGPIALLATTTVAMGIAAEPCFILAQRTADQLLNPAAYIQAVLSGQT